MNNVAVIALVVMAAVNLLWGLVALVVLSRVFRLFRRSQSVVEMVQNELRPCVNKAHEILRKASRVADRVIEKADRVQAIISRVETTTAQVWNGADGARLAVHEQLIPVKSLWAGVRAGLRVFSQEIAKPKRITSAARRRPGQLQPIPSESSRVA